MNIYYRKKIKKIIAALAVQSLIFFCSASPITVLIDNPILETEDVPGWLAAIDSIYNQVDQITHAITQIEQQYEQMQFYIKRAENFKWQDIKWDGDLDFRNEITQATKQVDRQLTNIRKIKSNFNSKKITMNGKNFSLKDLCGMGDDSDLTLETFMQETYKSTKNSFRKAADQFVNGISEEEGARIYAKYGLSPANYWMVQTAKKKVNAILSENMAEIEEDTVKLKNEEMNKSIENVMKMIEEKSEDNLTEVQMAQINAALQKLSIEQMQKLQYDLNKASAGLCYYLATEEQNQELKNESKSEIINRLIESRTDKIPSNF